MPHPRTGIAHYSNDCDVDLWPYLCMLYVLTESEIGCLQQVPDGYGIMRVVHVAVRATGDG